jgi:hypothetical protein
MKEVKELQFIRIRQDFNLFRIKRGTGGGVLSTEKKLNSVKNVNFSYTVTRSVVRYQFDN